MSLVELPSDLLNIVLTYLFEDVSQQEEVTEEDTKRSNKKLNSYMNKLKKNGNDFYNHELYSLCYTNKRMAMYISCTKLGLCFFRHITPPILTDRIFTKKKKILQFFKKHLLSHGNGNNKNNKFLCKIEENDIGIETTKPLFVIFRTKNSDDTNEDSKMNRIAYEYDGFAHRILGVESIFTSATTGKLFPIPAKYFSELSTINFEPVIIKDKLSVSVNIDTPDFESLDLRFHLLNPTHKFEKKAWGIL
jgi:hypothetical protein